MNSSRRGPTLLLYLLWSLEDHCLTFLSPCHLNKTPCSALRITKPTSQASLLCTPFQRLLDPKRRKKRKVGFPTDATTFIPAHLIRLRTPIVSDNQSRVRDPWGGCQLDLGSMRIDRGNQSRKKGSLAVLYGTCGRSGRKVFFFWVPVILGV
jgi:hypothetical protein